MARKPRTQFPGAVYHVTARGNAKAKIFLTDADRELFLKLLAQTIVRFGWKLHAYCLMDNHYHLLVETPEPNLSHGMQLLGGTYTQAFNRLHGRVGHVFQGRYKTIIVEKESHLLEVVRYIVLNPVAAHAAHTPGEWQWSSYKATAGITSSPPWLATGSTLQRFHETDRTKAERGYKRFVGSLVSKSPFEGVKLGLVLGSDEFAESIKPLIHESASRDKSARVPIQSPAIGTIIREQKNRAERNRRMLEACDTYRYTLKEIGEHVGMHECSVSRVLKGERLKMSRCKA